MVETEVKPYSLSDEHADKLAAALNSQADQDSVTSALRKSLQSHCDAVIDQYTSYLSDEYILVIEDIAKNRATSLVKELLKGNHEVAQFFSLEASTLAYGADAGKPFVYDPDEIRRAIFNKFCDEITHAELIGLREDNQRLRDALAREREMRRY